MAEEYLIELKNVLLSRNEKVGSLEFTSGNYDDAGRLIGNPVPTITTELCEIGIHGDSLYFVVIIPTTEFSRGVFEGLRGQDVKIYGLKDFRTTLFDKQNQATYENVRNGLHDEFVQVQFDFPWREMSVEFVVERYFEVMEIFNGIKVVNQLIEGI